MEKSKTAIGKRRKIEHVMGRSAATNEVLSRLSICWRSRGPTSQKRPFDHYYATELDCCHGISRAPIFLQRWIKESVLDFRAGKGWILEDRDYGVGKWTGRPLQLLRLRSKYQFRRGFPRSNVTAPDYPLHQKIKSKADTVSFITEKKRSVWVSLLKEWLTEKIHFLRHFFYKSR